MSRFKKFAHSLLSGYVLMGANIVFTLLSIPLALRYLSKAEFGLWAMTTQLGTYIALIDLGMAGVSRIIVDYKDNKEQGAYGEVIQTFLLVSFVQSLLIFVCGTGLAFVLAPWLNVPPLLEKNFVLLIMGQCAILAVSFLTRIFIFLLAAHQRYDVSNYAQTLTFISNFGVLWFSFKNGAGVFALLYAQASGLVVIAFSTAIACMQLKLFPPKNCWGRPTRKRFRELFIYGQSFVVLALGNQLVFASQIILITRTLDLEAAAIWTVCTRTYQLITQVIYRIFDLSCAAFAEMIVRKETEKLYSRFKSMVTLSSSLSVIAAVMFILCNQSFMEVWSGKRIGWLLGNDILLAVWLLILVPVHCHSGLVGQTMEFRFMPYVFLLEGATFIGFSLLTLRHAGIPGMILVSILSSLMWSFPYTIRRTARYFNLSWKEVAVGWSYPPLRLILFLSPPSLLTWWLTQELSAGARLLICGGVSGALGLCLLLRFGLDKTLENEIAQKIPTWLQRLLFGLPPVSK